MGLLDILNGMQNGPRGATEPGKGGMSPITMALLGLLAFKAYQKMSSGSSQPQPDTVPPDRGQVPNMPDNPLAPSNNPLTQASAQDGGGLGSLLPGGLGGVLGGLLGGAAGGSVLSGGLNDLLERLNQNGLGDKGQSWVNSGENQSISPSDLHRALGSDTISTLAEHSGMSEQDVLNALSRQLPDAINHMTPKGRLPTEREMSDML